MSPGILCRGLIFSRITRPAVLSPSSIRGICHKDHIDPEIKADKPKPWPYDRRKWSYIHQNVLRVDRTVSRFDENTKVICIEGPIYSGKSAFGMELAEKLGMRYYGAPNVEDVLRTTDNDKRLYNWQLPEEAQFCDRKLFLLKNDHKAANMVWLREYQQKYFHYVEGLAHLFNTGDGVIHESSVWSDYVYWKALVNANINPIIGNECYEYYSWIRKEGLTDLLRPHLVIYLDIPPEKVLENIQKKGIDYEMNSPVLKRLDVMQDIDRIYKEEFLPDIAKHAEVLVYDWSEGGDMDLVIEDLEKLDFDQYEGRGERTEDWRWYKETDFDDLRRLYTNHRSWLYCYFSQPCYDRRSVMLDFDTARARQAVEDYHNLDWCEGYNPAHHKWWQLGLKGKDYWRYKWEIMYFGQTLRDKWTELKYF